MKNQEEHEKRLDELFDKLADIVTNGEASKKGYSFHDYMTKPIITITISRRDTNIEVTDCNRYDVKKAVTILMSDLLEMLNRDERNEVIAKAIEITNDTEVGDLDAKLAKRKEEE